MARKPDIKDIDKIVKEEGYLYRRERFYTKKSPAKDFRSMRLERSLGKSKSGIRTNRTSIVSTIPEEIRNSTLSLIGLNCWYISIGGAASSTFEIVLGGKRPRPRPLKNTNHSTEFRNFSGDASVFVWCAWRLDGEDGPLTSWDDTEQSIREILLKLIDTRLVSIDLAPNTWDVNIRFSNNLCLRVFCDHVPGDPSFDGNWEVSTHSKIVAFGPGSQYRIEIIGIEEDKDQAIINSLADA